LEVKKRGGRGIADDVDVDSDSGGGERRRLMGEGREGLTVDPARSRWSLVAVNCMS